MIYVQVDSHVLVYSKSVKVFKGLTGFWNILQWVIMSTYGHYAVNYTYHFILNVSFYSKGFYKFFCYFNKKKDVTNNRVIQSWVYE